MKVAMFPAPSGTAYWRMIDPAKYLKTRGIDVVVTEEGITEDIVKWADILVLENCIDKKGIALINAYQEKFGKKLISDWDDYIVTHDYNPYKKMQKIKDFVEVSKIILKISDVVTVTNKFLKKLYSEYNSNIHILPNYMDLERWDVPKKKNDSKYLRIGWAGSITHYDDLKMIEKPLKRILKEFRNTQLVTVGDTRTAEMFKGYNVEAMLGVPFDYWPEKLSGLRLDIGLAPLVDNQFNRCKSNIKWQEYSVAQIPGVYSDVVYPQAVSHIRFDGVLGMVAKSEEEWYRCIKNYIICKNLRDDISVHAYSLVKQEYNLEQNIDKWVKVYK